MCKDHHILILSLPGSLAPGKSPFKFQPKILVLECVTILMLLFFVNSSSAVEAKMKPGKVFKDCPSCPSMVVIPPGSFDMGKTGSTHQVTLKQFAMGKTEVTQGQWKALMGNNPSVVGFCGDDCPVNQVSWIDAQVFIQKLSALTGKRYYLPSEAEWEYACRAGKRQEYCGSDDINTVAWYGMYSFGTIHKVARKKANAFGLYDMTGNVWEWVQDSFHPNFVGAPTDGSAWQGPGNVGRVFRGNSWIDSPPGASAAERDPLSPDRRFGDLGFRVARALADDHG